MQYRRALISVVASASLLGTAGVAHATHQSDPNYSPCRPPGADVVHAGYSDAPDRTDPRHELPTVYAGGDTSPSGHLGICGGSGADIQYVEVGGNATDAPYLHHSDASTSGQPTDQLGALTIGSDYIEVDGAKDNPATTVDPRLDGYASVGLTENPNLDDPSDNGPGICASGDNNHAYYQADPTAKDCNEQLLGIVVGELPG